jgi:hypothetical protein
VAGCRLGAAQFHTLDRALIIRKLRAKVIFLQLCFRELLNYEAVSYANQHSKGDFWTFGLIVYLDQRDVKILSEK